MQKMVMPLLLNPLVFSRFFLHVSVEPVSLSFMKILKMRELSSKLCLSAEHFTPLLEQIAKLEEALYNIQFEQHWLEAQTDRQAIGTV